jgi:hypothetical protein
MDIKQILDQAQTIDFSTLDSAGAEAEVLQIESRIREIQTFIDSLHEVRRGGQNRMAQIAQEIMERENALEKEKLGQQGIKVGDIYYIDRHDGVYVISDITKDKVRFDRWMDGSTSRSWSKGKLCIPGNFDPRLTPLRTQGPFKVGDIVTRAEQEFTVMGYLGFRMVLKGQRYGNTFYSIIAKKDEKTYRSIIF